MFPRQPTRATVPSRGALRVLRQIAWAGTTIGAIGGFCAVGTITYDLHRRVQYAERIVQTKRSLQTSCPNYAGTGAATMSQMMEAAEAGEFLGLVGFKRKAARARRLQQEQEEGLADEARGEGAKAAEDKDGDTGISSESLEAADIASHDHLKPATSPLEADKLSPDSSTRRPSRKAYDPDSEQTICVPEAFREKYQNLPPTDPVLAVQRLLDERLLGEASVKFLRYATVDGIKHDADAMKDMGLHLLYTNLHRNRVAMAQKIFYYYFGEKGMLSAPLWEILMLAYWRNGRYETLSTLYLDYANKFELSPAMLRVVLKSLLICHRLSAAKALLFKHIQNDKACGACGIYLEKLWQRTRSIVLVESQFRKLLDTLATHKIAPTKRLFDPLLMAYVEFGMYDKADLLVATMQDVYNIKLEHRTLGLVAYGKALKCDWEGVKQVMVKMHELNIPSEHSRMFAHVFHRVFLEFWVANPGYAVYEFVFDAINNFGLAPDKLLFEQIVKAFIQKGTVEMVEELLQTAEAKNWNVKLERAYFMGLLQEARLSAKCSPAGLWRMFRATEQKFAYAAASRQVLGYDTTSFPVDDSEKKPNSEETAAMWRRAMTMPESSRHLRQFTPLHVQMMHFINVGKTHLALTSFRDASKSGMVMKHLHLNLAVTASILMNGDTRDAKAILEEFKALQAPGRPVPPLFFQGVMRATALDETEALKMAVFNYYAILEQKLLPIKHMATNCLAGRLCLVGNHSAVLDIFRTVNKSKYAVFTPFDSVSLQYLVRAFARTGNFKGVRWAIFTALNRPSALGKRLIDEVELFVARAGGRSYRIPNHFTREIWDKERKRIASLATVLRFKYKTKSLGRDRYITFPEVIKALREDGVQTEPAAAAAGAAAKTTKTAKPAPQLTGDRSEDFRYMGYIIDNWRERAEFEKCFPPNEVEEKDWSEDAVLAEGMEEGTVDEVVEEEDEEVGVVQEPAAQGERV
ncbi:hypothetical protein AJ79_00638 [Helicocarpus griseus UAMH5409]|uniref:Pentatricopeptide repeat protein n=1 Tax=Helicocarpus griseus UAMH5409 TaxID=1447875 RepID=A0A2B7YB24_9EURO|nr:hypothetical protein AJ79_00638 [Helicocarpus griseus UAMH5409]